MKEPDVVGVVLDVLEGVLGRDFFTEATLGNLLKLEFLSLSSVVLFVDEPLDNPFELLFVFNVFNVFVFEGEAVRCELKVPYVSYTFDLTQFSVFQ